MFCNQCGKQVADGVKFCPACGNQFKQNTSVSQPAQPQMQPPQVRMQSAPVQPQGQQPMGSGVNGGMNPAASGAMGHNAYVGYPPNWVGSLALIPNFKMCMTKKYASFTGRATRAEYWRFVLANSVFTLLIITLIGLIFDNFIISYGASVALNLVFLLPCLGISVRRLHDTGRSGWWLLISFVPLINIALFVFMLLPSTPGPNPYGPLPDYTYYEG
ncbi:MAG: DUF805 domain-containing protein [Veillonella caviae]|nr:DUF805 domain-containing protein [Veillonella caviae]